MQASLNALLIPLLHSSFDTSTYKRSLDRYRLGLLPQQVPVYPPGQYWESDGQFGALISQVFCPNSLYREAAALLKLHPETGQYERGPSPALSGRCDAPFSL